MTKGFSKFLLYLEPLNLTVERERPLQWKYVCSLELNGAATPAFSPLDKTVQALPEWIFSLLPLLKLNVALGAFGFDHTLTVGFTLSPFQVFHLD